MSDTWPPPNAVNKEPIETATDPAVIDEIVDQVADGIPLAQALRTVKGAPSKSHFYRITERNEDVRNRMEAARADGADAIAHRLRATARGYTADKGGESSGDVRRDKLIVETDLKLLAKWHPKQYGDRVTLAGDPEAPLSTVSDDQLNARIKQLMQAQGGAEE